MSQMVIDRNSAKVETAHRTRVVHSFHVGGERFNVVNTKHGLYRTLEKKKMKVQDIGSIITSVSEQQWAVHFQCAKAFYNENASWERKIDYVVSIYDVIHGIVLMVGLHPHLNRVTVITIIPRIYGVRSNDVHACYRIDSNETKNTYIKHLIPKNIKMEKILRG